MNSPKSEQLARIAELVAGGDVRVEIAEAMPLADVKRAHELSESGHVRGKLVLTVGDEARLRSTASAYRGSVASGRCVAWSRS